MIHKLGVYLYEEQAHSKMTHKKLCQFEEKIKIKHFTFLGESLSVWKAFIDATNLTAFTDKSTWHN